MGTLAVSGHCILKAGQGSISGALFIGANAETNWNTLIAMGESVLCVATRRNWVSEYSGLNSTTKLILQDFVSNFAGIHAIAQNIDETKNRINDEDKITVLRDGMNRDLKILVDQKGTTFIV